MSLCQATGESFGQYCSTSVRYKDASYTLIFDISATEDRRIAADFLGKGRFLS